MMLALFPFGVFSLSVASAFVSEVGAKDLSLLLYGTWPESIAAPIEREFRAVLQQSGIKSLTVGGLLALFFASNGVDALRVALSEAYHDEDPLNFVRGRLRCIAFVLGGSMLMIPALVFTVGLPPSLAPLKKNYPFLDISFLTVDALRIGVATLLLAVVLLACHRWLPGRRQQRPLRDLFPGVVLTLVLWGMSAKLFGYYIEEFATYSVTYAGLAGIMAALIFMYLMAALFILGAEFNGRLIAARELADGPQ